MITKRIIPCLDVKDGRVVKGVNFSGLRDVASPVELAKRYSQQGADELVFYDITASAEGRALFTDILTETARSVFIPLTVGGGINSEKDFERVLACGAANRRRVEHRDDCKADCKDAYRRTEAVGVAYSGGESAHRRRVARRHPTGGYEIHKVELASLPGGDRHLDGRGDHPSAESAPEYAGRENLPEGPVLDGGEHCVTSS